MKYFRLFYNRSKLLEVYGAATLRKEIHLSPLIWIKLQLAVRLLTEQRHDDCDDQEILHCTGCILVYKPW